MVGAGFLLLLFAVYALFLVMGEVYEGRPGFLKILPFAIALPYFANTAGWIMTEVGRAPWIVFGLMTIEQGVSPTVPGGMVLASLLLFTLTYGVLMVANVYLLVKFAKAGTIPRAEPSLPPDAGLSFVGAQD
jgi:cytochrome d ubiquinol oxidase subunit I